METRISNQTQIPSLPKVPPGEDSVHEPVRGYTPKQVERIATITNHVSEDMLDLVTKRDLVDAVKYWSLEHSYKCAELSSLETELLMLATRGAINRAINSANDQSDRMAGATGGIQK
jgi:hypothetical protein